MTGANVSDAVRIPRRVGKPGKGTLCAAGGMAPTIIIERIEG